MFRHTAAAETPTMGGFSCQKYAGHTPETTQQSSTSTHKLPRYVLYAQLITVIGFDREDLPATEVRRRIEPFRANKLGVRAWMTRTFTLQEQPLKKTLAAAGKGMALLSTIYRYCCVRTRHFDSDERTQGGCVYLVCLAQQRLDRESRTNLEFASLSEAECCDESERSGDLHLAVGR